MRTSLYKALKTLGFSAEESFSIVLEALDLYIYYELKDNESLFDVIYGIYLWGNSPKVKSILTSKMSVSYKKAGIEVTIGNTSVLLRHTDVIDD